jgi:hypothetical protein
LGLWRCYKDQSRSWQTLFGQNGICFELMPVELFTFVHAYHAATGKQLSLQGEHPMLPTPKIFLWPITIGEMRMARSNLSDFDAGTRCYEAGRVEKALVFFRQGAQ